MPNVVRVRWSIFGVEDPFEQIAANIETDVLVHGGCEASAQIAIDVISAGYFNDRMWESLFGLDLVEAEVLLEISEPDGWAGAFEVSLSRVTRAECRRVVDPRIMRGPLQLVCRSATQHDEVDCIPEPALL